ncbi:MAG: MFS transporter [Pseudomonadota bacterium]
MGADRRNVVAGMAGNVLEWYDFAVYGFLAPILGKAFFPADDPVASLLAAFGVFAVGYAARPLGGALFGHIGDRFGRKTCLVLSICLMGGATASIGLLPDHAALGTTAAALLVLLRVFQGLSVGGEFTGSIVFLAEHAPPAHRGLRASWPQFGCLIGFLLGSGVGALTSTVLGEAAMAAWGWRVPFLLGAVIALCGIFFRRNLTESPAMAQATERMGAPVIVALRDYWPVILKLISLVMIAAVGFYMIFVYAASYLTGQMHLSTAKALDINTLSLLVMLAVTVPGAMLSDRFGRRPLLLFFALGTLLCAWPLWWLMHQQSFALILLGQMGFALFFGVGFAVVPATMIELLPPQVRCSGVSIGYNACIGLLGGTTPLIATYLTQRTADDFAPVYYLMAAAALNLFIIRRLPETAGKPLPT